MTHRTTTPEPTLSHASRIILAVLGTLGFLLLVLAGSLEPDPRGFGTHEQLGLTPCFFQQWTGKPCPTCGTTTAWAYALQGKFTSAVAANLGGVVLLLFVVVGLPWTLITAVRGKWLGVQPTPKMGLVVATAWLALLVFDWIKRWFMS